MKKTILLYSLILVSTAIVAQKRTNIKLNPKNFILEIKMDTNFCLGCEMPFSLELISKKPAEIFDLETAGLNFTIHKFMKGQFEPFGLPISIGGPVGFFKDTGEDGIKEFGEYELKQTKVKVKGGKKLSKSFELYSLTNSYLLFPGKYEISIEYEFQLRDKICFIILYDYEQDIPRLISHLEQKKSYGHGAQTPLDVIYTLTGYPNWRNLSKQDHFNDVPRVKQWWEENKDAILTVEATLKDPRYSKFIYKDQLPMFIRNLHSKNISEQRQAKQALFYITGSPSWIDLNKFDEQTIQKEIGAINNWWQKNQKVVEYVNLIIVSEFM